MNNNSNKNNNNINNINNNNNNSKMISSNTPSNISSTEQVVDLEEAVGSYLNCLSTSCAAGSKLYTSVGKFVDDKFEQLFPGKETKLYFQTLQTQNAFEGYQKALLECKEKLLEILIDNHTKKQPVKQEKGKHGKMKSTEEEVL